MILIFLHGRGGGDGSRVDGVDSLPRCWSLPAHLRTAIAAPHAMTAPHVATYSLFLSTKDATLFEGARLVQARAGSLAELEAAV